MDPLTVAVGANLLQGGLNAYFHNRGIDKTNKANMELAEYQYKKDREMYDYNNQYNHPLQQMNRLREAGLNPNLVYGNGAIGNTSGQIPQYSAPKLDYNYKPPVDLGSVIQAYQSMKINQAQTDNIVSQTKKNEAETVNSVINSGILKSDAEIKKVSAQYAPTLQKLGVSRETEQIELMQKQAVVSALEAELKRLEVELNKKGIQKNDSLPFRILTRMLNDLGIDSESVKKELNSRNAWGEKIERKDKQKD